MKSFLTLFVLFISISTFSQEEKKTFLIEKGTKALEGNFSIGSSSNEFNSDFANSESTGFNITISPRFGYAIQDNLILGLQLSYAHSNSDTDNSGQQANSIDYSRTNTYGIAPYIKKYFSLSETFAFHLQGELNFLFGNDTFDDFLDVERKVDRNVIFIGVRPGFTFRANDHLLFQANFGSLGYSNLNIETDDSTEQKSSSLGLNLDSSSLLFGFTYLF